MVFGPMRISSASARARRRRRYSPRLQSDGRSLAVVLVLRQDEAGVDADVDRQPFAGAGLQLARLFANDSMQLEAALIALTGRLRPPSESRTAPGPRRRKLVHHPPCLVMMISAVVLISLMMSSTSSGRGARSTPCIRRRRRTGSSLAGAPGNGNAAQGFLRAGNLRRALFKRLSADGAEVAEELVDVQALRARLTQWRSAGGADLAVLLIVVSTRRAFHGAGIPP